MTACLQHLSVLLMYFISFDRNCSMFSWSSIKKIFLLILHTTVDVFHLVLSISLIICIVATTQIQQASNSLDHAFNQVFVRWKTYNWLRRAVHLLRHSCVDQPDRKQCQPLWECFSSGFFKFNRNSTMISTPDKPQDYGKLAVAKLQQVPQKPAHEHLYDIRIQFTDY